MVRSRSTRRQSAGLLLFRRPAGPVEVLLVHPGGPFWARRDEGAWSLPKGEIEEGEDPLAVARREFVEELGAPPIAEPAPLEPVHQAGGKLVMAWACEGDFDVSGLHSNTFAMEWPPRSGRQQEFPEVDRAEWFPLAEARRRILAGQLPLLDQLERVLGNS
jgi:predicted NUDIX family NTP pyrophosphohydrolase